MPRGSFNTNEMQAGGGLYEGPAELSNARVGKSDYGGKSAAGMSTAILLNYTYVDADDQEQVREMILGMGKGLEPSIDGEEISEEGPFYVPTVEGKKLNDGTNAGIFLKSLAKARGQELDDEAGISDLNGLKVVLTRVTLPPIEEGGKPRKVYTVSEVVNELPWEKKTAKAAPAKKAGTGPKAK